MSEPRPGNARTEVLSIGDSSASSTARHRADALARLGCAVTLFNPGRPIKGRVGAMIDYKTGHLWGAAIVRRRLAASLAAKAFDLVVVNGGETIDRTAVRWLKRSGRIVVNYNNDDPFGGRDGRRWWTWRRALPEYSAFVAVRPANVEEARRAGARDVIRVFMSCDEVAHAPRVVAEEVRRRWASEVVFVGTWMPERGPLLADLGRRGLALSIHGHRWDRAREWPDLRRYWKGPAVDGDDYAYAIQCAKVALGLVSRGNRDQHTQRSAEIPFLGGVLCAEDTPEHRSIFRDGVDAALFADADEAERKIRILLADASGRGRMAASGRERVLAAGMTNERVMAVILRHAQALRREQGDDRLSGSKLLFA